MEDLLPKFLDTMEMELEYNVCLWGGGIWGDAYLLEPKNETRK